MALRSAVTMNASLSTILAFLLWASTSLAFAPLFNSHEARTTVARSVQGSSSTDATAPTDSTSVEELNRLKANLVRSCSVRPKPALEGIKDAVRELESAAELLGVGQASSLSGLLNGEWELLYAPEDETRSSPFFWAFRKAFPDSSDQIFGITDAIPAPIKEVGPAYQQIDLDPTSQTGRFVSRVKVATLGGMATSIMTTRGSIIGVEGLDGLRLKIETTKPENSTLFEKLGPLGNVLNENAPPFPSGVSVKHVHVSDRFIVSCSDPSALFPLYAIRMH